MGVEFNGTYDGQAFVFSSSYSVVYTTSTTIKVSIDLTSEGTTQGYDAWIQRDGTVLAIDLAGDNLTGTQAQATVDGIFVAFFLEQSFGQLYTPLLSSGYFQDNGQATVSIGSTTVHVTNYGIPTAPETVNCNGVTVTLDGFSMSIGTPHGSSSQLMTSLYQSGQETADGQTYTFDFTLELLSVTVA